MPIVIDGIKYPIKDLEGTDVHCVHKFLNHSKSKAAVMIYVDEEGNIETSYVYKRKKDLEILFNKIHLRIINKPKLL